MLLPISILKSINEFKDIAEEELEREIKAIEQAIRSHTNNKFQNKYIRSKCRSKNGNLIVNNPYLKVEDTIEISDSINNGLYVVKEINNTHVKLDRCIYDSEYNLITKIEYPDDVILGAIDLLKWRFNPDRKKIQSNIASESESLSRHSTTTTYKTYDKSNLIKGYPIELFDFCSSYRKMRT